jgi:hypothetical protein
MKKEEAIERERGERLANFSNELKRKETAIFENGSDDKW